MMVRSALLPASVSCGEDTVQIIATACVAPPALALGPVRADPLTRLNDYAQNLAIWALNEDRRLGPLSVVENSGFDPDRILDATKEVLAGRAPLRSIEIVSYSGPPRPEGVHYGFSEFETIDDLKDYLQILRGQFIKVTGRYSFPGLSRWLDRLPGDARFVCDAQIIPWPLSGAGRKSCLVPLFYANSDWYDSNIRRLHLTMDGSHRKSFIEDVIFDTFLDRHGRDGIYLRYPVNCSPMGIGGNGDNMNSYSKAVKGAIRAVARATGVCWL